MKKVYDLLVREKELLKESQEWVAKAARYDYEAEKLMLQMSHAQADPSFEFTIGDHTVLDRAIESYQTAAYAARLNSCKIYKQYMKTRKRREHIVRENSIPRHGAR